LGKGGENHWGGTPQDFGGQILLGLRGEVSQGFKPHTLTIKRVRFGEKHWGRRYFQKGV